MQDVSDTSKLGSELVELMPALRKFARRFHASPYDIDDLVQETVMKALSNSEKFQEGTRLKSWLFTIMRNTFCTKFGISKREHVGFEEGMAQSPCVQPSQEWSIRGRELEGALAQLSVPYRIAIELIFIEGSSYEKAAERCGCKVGTVKSRVNRARQQIAVLMQEHAT